MSAPESHRGANRPGLPSARGDGRIQAIFERILEQPLAATAHRPVADSMRTTELHKQRQGGNGPFRVGTVIHAVPHLNWYKVQLSDSGGWVAACRGLYTGCAPVGPRAGHTVPSGSRVLVYSPPDFDSSVIVCVLPHQLEDGRVAVPGWLTQGSGVGLKREAAHSQPLTGMYRQGGVRDFSCQSPVDSTSLDWSMVTETGLALLLSPYELSMRVNEMCGLFLNYFDSHACLAGWQLELTSAAHAMEAGHDDGECRFRELVALYPWEAVGLYAPGESLTATFDDKDVHYSSHKGKRDLPDGAEDAEPFYRTRRYGGYEGQGGQRLVVAPPRHSGRRQHGDGEDDVGLFCESIGLDGAYLLQSAKSVIIAKSCAIAVPRQVRPDHDPAGNDAASGGYKFSGYFNDGDEHRIGDVRLPEDAARLLPLLRVAGARDLLAHAVNWQRLHPFHYRAGDYGTAEDERTNDYRVPQASSGPLGRAQEPLAFDVLTTQGYLHGPAPVRLRIDHRYGDVEYFQRTSMLALLDDGSVVLQGGGGEQLVFTGGTVRIDAPGNIELVPGRDLVAIARTAVIKAQGSVDITSSAADVRLYAQGNMQLGCAGGVLIEAQGDGLEQDYKDKVGEDVVSAGIVLKSASGLAALGQEVYIRSGADGTRGNIVLDAASMFGNVAVVAGAVECVLSQGALNVWHTDALEGPVVHSHQLARDGASLGGDVVVAGSALFGAARRAEVTLRGSLVVTDNVGAGGQVASKDGGALRKTSEGSISSARERAAQADRRLKELNDLGTEALALDVTGPWYADGRPGNSDVLGDIGYSHRDPDEPGAQYGTKDLAFLEPRWVAMARLGEGGGGELWEESPVSYQGRLLFPWPGRVQWLDEGAFVRLEDYALYDPAAGAPADRPEPYEGAALARLERASMAQGSRVIPRSS